MEKVYAGQDVQAYIEVRTQVLKDGRRRRRRLRPVGTDTDTDTTLASDLPTSLRQGHVHFHFVVLLPLRASTQTHEWEVADDHK